MNRLFFAILLCVFASLPVRAQLFSGYLPSNCVNRAAATLTGASDATVIGILSVGVSVPIGGNDLFLGMDLDDGTSPVWVYLVSSEELDTIAVTPLVRIFNQCVTPPVEGLDPGFDDFDGLQQTALPETFLEGAELTGNVKANSDYQEWAVAHPDSSPSVIVLASTDEDFLGFPAGTPFWALNWVANEPGTLPFLCVVHATTGQTICFGEDVVSVDDQGERGTFALAPNPATQDVVVSLPQGWLGRNVSVDAVDLHGRTISLFAGTVSMEQLFLSAAALAPGTWQIRVSDGHTISTMPLAIVR